MLPQANVDRFVTLLSGEEGSALRSIHCFLKDPRHQCKAKLLLSSISLLQ